MSGVRLTRADQVMLMCAAYLANDHRARPDRDMLAMLSDVLPDVAVNCDHPLYAVRGAVTVCLSPHASASARQSALSMLRLCLGDYFRDRARAAYGDWRAEQMRGDHHEKR